MTTQIKGYPFEVIIRAAGISGAVLSDQVKNLDWRARSYAKRQSVGRRTGRSACQDCPGCWGYGECQMLTGGTIRATEL